MKKPRYLDRDGLDGILPTSGKVQPKSDNPQPRPDKSPAKSTRSKVWLLSGLGVLLLGGFLLRAAVQNPPLLSGTVASNSTLPAPASSGEPAFPTAAPEQPEPTHDPDVNADQAVAILPADQAAPSDRQPTESEVLAALPTEPTAAGIPKSPVDAGSQAAGTTPFTVYFKFDSSRLGRLPADESAGLLSTSKACQGRISLIGHTCNLGPDASNLLLGQARANTLKKWLIRNGVTAERIVTASEGMSKPVSPNDTKAGQALNRRVELYCLDN